MRRREFFGVLAGAAATQRLAARAQAATVARVGFLATGSADSSQVRADLEAFRQGLLALGYDEDRNIVIEMRAADGAIERLPDLAAEFARAKVNVIVALATPAGRAAQQATASIPIVVSAMGDPVKDGLVASLARPGGNITGNTFLGPELVTKRLSLLKELIPTMSRIAVLWHPGAFSEQTTTAMLKDLADAAGGMGVQLQAIGARSRDEFEHAFSEMVQGHPDAMLELPSPMFFVEKTHIIDLAARHRLPAMYNAREFVQLGGLIAYGASISDLHRRAAIYVDKILKGAKPSDLPVEQPTKFELFINRKTAETLGLKLSQMLLATADAVIE